MNFTIFLRVTLKLHMYLLLVSCPSSQQILATPLNYRFNQMSARYIRTILPTPEHDSMPGDNNRPINNRTGTLYLCLTVRCVYILLRHTVQMLCACNAFLSFLSCELTDWRRTSANNVPRLLEKA